jgi:DNA-directed RNA polymerase subunit F
VRSIPEATEIIRRCVTDSSYVSFFEPAMARFRRCYFSAVGPEAAERAVDEIASLVKGRQH